MLSSTVYHRSCGCFSSTILVGSAAGSGRFLLFRHHLKTCRQKRRSTPIRRRSSKLAAPVLDEGNQQATLTLDGIRSSVRPTSTVRQSGSRPAQSLLQCHTDKPLKGIQLNTGATRELNRWSDVTNSSTIAAVKRTHASKFVIGNREPNPTWEREYSISSLVTVLGECDALVFCFDYPTLPRGIAISKPKPSRCDFALVPGPLDRSQQEDQITRDSYESSRKRQSVSSFAAYSSLQTLVFSFWIRGREQRN
ncbi:hypothetical protein NMY22_g4157 [Coprinellus aureogranulatus]|nr:hypothetical protein NMY22_g4157 [Coprinellus aureogranulatus]